MTTPYVILGTGQLGLAIMGELVAQGKDVTIVNRRGTLNEPLPSGVQIQQADANDPAAITRVAQGAQTVFTCVQPEYKSGPNSFPLNQAVMDGVRRLGPSWFLATISICMALHRARPFVKTCPMPLPGARDVHARLSPPRCSTRIGRANCA